MSSLAGNKHSQLNRLFGFAFVFLPFVLALGLNGCAGVVSGTTNGGPSPLNIANVQVLSATTSTCQIAWTTDVPADSAVDYGNSITYGSSTTVDPAMVTNHVVTIYSLAPAVTYYYQVRSTDSKTNHGQSGGHNFKTNGLSITGTISPATGGNGAAVSLAGAGAGTVTADGAGNFIFSGLPNGTYSVTPTHAGYLFAPSNQNVTLNGSNATGVNFTDAAQTFSISGTITPIAGASGASVTLSGTASATTTANASGAYTFTGLLSGSYTVTPSNAGYTFTPPSLSVGISTTNVTGANFTDNSVAVAPTITAQPVSQTVTAGQTAAFTVAATGTAPLSYQWQKNGVNIAGATAASYTTPATTTSDSGSTFRVVVSNSVGAATSASATLTVSAAPVAPTVTAQPVSQTVTAGQAAAFTAVATGTAPLGYQWQKNGANIGGATAATYTTPVTTTADNGSTFRVVVSNSVGSATSASATLTVNAAPVAPTITAQPANQTVTAGQAAAFTVAATGTAPLGYQWQKNGVNIVGATTGSYTTPATTTSDSGSTFRVVVSNSVGSVTSAAATLTVNAAPVAPTITAQPVSQTVTAGQTAAFTVAATGTAPLSYQWQKNGVNIAGATAASYTTPATTTSDSGSAFAVSVSNTAGTVTSGVATLTVNPPPAQITSTPSSANFANVVTGTSNSQTITLTNGGGVSATISQANVSGASFTITGLAVPVTIAAGGKVTFNVVFAPTAIGVITGSVSLVSNAPGSPTAIALNGTGVAPTFVLGANPTSMGFGNVNVGSSSSSSTTLTNNGNSNVTISSVTVTGAGLSASGVASGTVLIPNQSIALNTTFAPTAAGNVTGSISVASNATNSPAVITVTGSGIQPSTGPQFYVSTSGSDTNSGTSLSAAWRTIQKAMNSATPGSTVNILAGTYNERLTLNVSGTTGNYITFQPYGFSAPAGGCGGYTGIACGGDQVILDYGYLGTVTDSIPFLLISGRSYVKIQGLTFQNFTCTGPFRQGVRVDSGASFVEFDYNKFLNNRNTYPLFDGTSALLHIRIWSPSNNITFYGNELGNIETVMSEALTFEGSSAVSAENNWVHDTDGIGIDAHGGANNYTIRSNRLEYNSIRRDGTIWYNSPAAAIYNDGGNTGIIERNYVSHCGVGFQALSEPGMPATHDVTIRDNVAQYCQTGIVLGTWYSSTDGSSVSNINLFNNTFYSNNVGVNIRPMTSATVTWENNIFANNGVSYANALNWNPGNVNYNLYFGGGLGPGATVLTLDPLFTNAAGGDFSLQSISPAINGGDPNTSTGSAGTLDFAGNPRIQGGRVDIGAYEMR